MDTIQFTSDTIRMLGIHGLAVYMLMRCAEQDGLVPITHQWILDHMPGKTSPNTVTAELRRLTSPERQMAIRVKGGWRLNRENAFQLPLTYDLPTGKNLSQSENLALRDFGDSIIVIDSLINTESINNNNKAGNRAERGNLPQRGNLPLRDSLAQAALNRALADFKIVGKKKDELLACQWVTGEYVRASVEHEKWEPNPEYAVGRAILHMIDHQPQPVRSANGHIGNCGCTKCQVDAALGARSKYGGDWICETCHQHPCICESDDEG